MKTILLFLSVLSLQSCLPLVSLIDGYDSDSSNNSQPIVSPIETECLAIYLQEKVPANGETSTMLNSEIEERTWETFRQKGYEIVDSHLKANVRLWYDYHVTNMIFVTNVDSHLKFLDHNGKKFIDERNQITSRTVVEKELILRRMNETLREIPECENLKVDYENSIGSNSY